MKQVFIYLLLIMSLCSFNKSESIRPSNSLTRNIISSNPSPESIAKELCNCSPVSVFRDIYDDKIFYITQENTGESWGENLVIRLNVAERFGYEWEIVKEQEIYSAEFVVVGNDDIKYSTKVIVNNKLYYFTPILLGHLGTANNGLNNYLFVFYDVENTNAPILINYEKVDGYLLGDYEIISSNQINKALSNHKAFIKETDKYVKKVFGDSNINSDHNYIAKWNAINEGDVLEKGKIIPTEYASDVLFNKYSDKENIFENNRYKVSGGFASPIVVYDKVGDKTKVLFIPNGLPAGCCWGTRSFYIKLFREHTIIAESNDDGIIEINILNQTIKSLKKIPSLDHLPLDVSIEDITPKDEITQSTIENTDNNIQNKPIMENSTLIILAVVIIVAIVAIRIAAISAPNTTTTERAIDRKGFNPNSYQGGHNKEENPPADTTNHQEKTTPDINYNGGHNA